MATKDKQFTELSEEEFKNVHGGLAGSCKKKDDKGNCIETIFKSPEFIVDPGIGPI